MKRLLYAVLLTLAALAMVLSLKNEFGCLLPSPGFGMSEIVNTGHVDYLFIGASTFRRGLDIEVLEELPGYSYLLTYNGNQPLLILMQIKYLLRKGVSIKNLYIDFYPYTVAQISGLSDSRILLDTDIQFKLDLYQVLNSEYIPPKKTTEWMGETTALFITANNQVILWYPIYRKLNLLRNRHGGYLNMRQQHGTTSDYLDNLPHFGKRDGIQSEQLQAILDIIVLCKQHHIKLRFLEIPKYHQLLLDPDYVEYATQIAQSIIETAGEDIIIHANQLPIDNKNPDYFVDLVHMSGIGAHEYTKMLAQMISDPDYRQ